MNYEELIKKYDFEQLEFDRDEAGFEDYNEIYTKTTINGEGVTLHFHKDEPRISISWTASGIDFHSSPDEAPAEGWAIDEDRAYPFLIILQEAYEIIATSKREYKVKLHIRKIEKLKPSICNEIEDENL